MRRPVPKAEPQPHPRLKDETERVLRGLSALAREIGILANEAQVGDPTPEQVSAAARRADECVTATYQFAHQVRRLRDAAQAIYNRAARPE